MQEIIKGYKVFNHDWTCRDFQYKVGETFTHNGNIKICGAGFHFCRKATDCFNYYNFNILNKVAEVEAIGNVETRDDKSVTDKIRIVREISWQELLTIVNSGVYCTGLGNTGNYNTGDYNAAYYNTGDWNTGDRNIGDCNTGDWNEGDYNVGSHNTGDYNIGDWNSANLSIGFFNNKSQPIYIFNKPTNMSIEDVYKCRGIQIINDNFKNYRWIDSKNMSDEEKSIHPEYETIGGYAKTVDFKTACKNMWDSLDDYDKKEIMNIPNFDAEVFKSITGISIKE